ncbi:MAG: permease-like cell division protein FtsX [Clostridia bacterium]|nr:permease-like cell division protein FtsX [Clostridia bacterium]
MRRYRPTYFLGQAFKGLWRNGMMTLASVTVLLSCLVVIGCFSMLVMNINRNLDSLGDLNEIVAFVDPDPSHAVGDQVTVAPALEAEGKTFLGWSTDPDATSAAYPAGGSYTVNASDAVSGVVTLYAVWAGGADADGYALRYHASGLALNGELPEDTASYQAGDVIHLPDALTARYSTIEFLGWSLSQDPAAEHLAPGSEYVISADDVKGGVITFYAAWSEMPAFASYTIVYDANRAKVATLPTDAGVRLDAIRDQLNKLDNVAEDGIEFISKEQTLEDEKEKLKDYPGILATLESGTNPYPDTFIITYEDNEEVAALEMKLEHIDGIYKIRCRSDLAESIASLKNGIILVFSWFMVILFAVSVFVIINTVKLAVAGRSKEISIMRYVGATKWFIVLPFALEGILIGLFSGGLAFLAQWYAYGYVQRMMTTDLQMIEIIPFSEIRILLLAGCLALGVVTGWIGSAIAIRRNIQA